MIKLLLINTIRIKELYELSYCNSLLYLETKIERLTAFLSRRLTFHERQYSLKCKFEIEKLMTKLQSLREKVDENNHEFIMQEGDKVFRRVVRLLKLFPLN